jgi:hypothetical protein
MKDVDANRIFYVKRNLVMGDGTFYQNKKNESAAIRPLKKYPSLVIKGEL